MGSGRKYSEEDKARIDAKRNTRKTRLAEINKRLSSLGIDRLQAGRGGGIGLRKSEAQDRILRGYEASVAKGDRFAVNISGTETGFGRSSSLSGRLYVVYTGQRTDAAVRTPGSVRYQSVVAAQVSKEGSSYVVTSSYGARRSFGNVKDARAYAKGIAHKVRQDKDSERKKLRG